MRYRIELSSNRNGFARINVPGRVIEVEAGQRMGAVWQVKLTEALAAGSEAPGSGAAGSGAAGSAAARSGAVTVRADNPNDAVWRVARAAVRAVSELTGSPIEGELSADPEKSPSNLQ